MNIPVNAGHFARCSGPLATYRDLCSLAADVQEPTLAYTFLYLANHQPEWNSWPVRALVKSSVSFHVAIHIIDRFVRREKHMSTRYGCKRHL